MEDIEQLSKILDEALEQYSSSRSFSTDLNALFAESQGNAQLRTLLRKLAFRHATNSIEEIGEIPTLDWLQQVVRGIYEGS
ncbi:hypothetical protein [Rubritalea marina]|uniref:hypothetical protein n=1 Tax=Rubritalea marina TaxID=361055 RepID=UPI00036DC169|nr:hypothetical protein [Rubritalea marina]